MAINIPNPSKDLLKALAKAGYESQPTPRASPASPPTPVRQRKTRPAAPRKPSKTVVQQKPVAPRPLTSRREQSSALFGGLAILAVIIAVVSAVGSCNMTVRHWQNATHATHR